MSRSLPGIMEKLCGTGSSQQLSCWMGQISLWRERMWKIGSYHLKWASGTPCHAVAWSWWNHSNDPGFLSPSPLFLFILSNLGVILNKSIISRREISHSAFRPVIGTAMIRPNNDLNSISARPCPWCCIAFYDRLFTACQVSFDFYWIGPTGPIQS